MNGSVTSTLLSFAPPPPVDPKHYADLSTAFGQYHKDPINVLLHLVTTPLGLIGVFGLLRSYTKSSSTSLFITCCYLASLLPVLSTGDFFGTTVLCFLIISVSRLFKITLTSAIVITILGYILQDLAHMGTGEQTFQSTYSGNNGHIDLSHPKEWLASFGEHVYFLLPLVAHVSVPLLPSSIQEFFMLNQPLPESLQKLHVFAWLLGPLVVFALGSYNLDSRNNFCFFPGTPYFYRVIQCNLKETSEGEDPQEAIERTKDMRTIREWTMDHNPSEIMSTHFWFSELPTAAKQAFHNIAHSKKVNSTFRSLFGESHYCVDVLPGMNEIYVSGPPREESAFNSDHVFYSRHVDGPFGFIPFVSVYRCIVGLDRNMMVSIYYDAPSH